MEQNLVGNFSDKLVYIHIQVYFVWTENGQFRMDNNNKYNK